MGASSGHKKALASLLRGVNTSKKLAVDFASSKPKSSSVSIQKLNITSEVADSFRAVLKKVRESLQDSGGKLLVDVQDFDLDANPAAGDVEIVDLDDATYAPIRQQLKGLLEHSTQPVFTNEHEFTRGLRFYSISVTLASGKKAFFLRSYSKKQQLAQSRGFGAWFSSGQFDRVKEPVFVFDDKVDCIVFEDALFILSRDRFMKMFRYFDQMRARAKKTLTTISTSLTIENVALLADLCEKSHPFVLKLNKIARRPYLSTLDYDAISLVLKALPKLGVKVVGKDGDRRIKFNQDDPWELLRVLDDDYLRSIMTQQMYEATGKRPPP